jgi:uncharacterized membrane protein YbhN (UPF0104 family)
MVKKENLIIVLLLVLNAILIVNLFTVRYHTISAPPNIKPPVSHK